MNDIEPTNAWIDPEQSSPTYAVIEFSKVRSGPFTGTSCSKLGAKNSDHGSSACIRWTRARLCRGVHGTRLLVPLQWWPTVLVLLTASCNGMAGRRLGSRTTGRTLRAYRMKKWLCSQTCFIRTRIVSVGREEKKKINNSQSSFGEVSLC